MLVEIGKYRGIIFGKKHYKRKFLSTFDKFSQNFRLDIYRKYGIMM